MIRAMGKFSLRESVAAGFQPFAHFFTTNRATDGRKRVFIKGALR
jgi:hypothetical protein